MELTPALKEKLNEHVGEHVDKWPATKDDLVAACNNMSDFDPSEKQWFSETLPAGTYRNADEVKRAIGA
jgi:hypothetical protein